MQLFLDLLRDDGISYGRLKPVGKHPSAPGEMLTMWIKQSHWQWFGTIVGRQAGNNFLVELGAASARCLWSCDYELNYLGASFGIAIADPSVDDIETVLKEADRLMYVDKQLRRGQGDLRLA